MAFRAKLLSSIRDYNDSFELLSYQYDRFLYRTITTAVLMGKRSQTSPARALEGKHFTTEYWRWQHRYLQDCVLQYSNPTFFVTINPYEWSFPQPLWMERALKASGKLPTNGGACETFTIAHALEQLCKGYITGNNSHLQYIINN